MAQTDKTEPDLEALGLPSHYDLTAKAIIKQHILEDWKATGQKLPSYVNLIARYIQGRGVPEIWLSKLIHQTLQNMLTGKNDPRYPFWACLHIYLGKKLGDISLNRVKTDVDKLGEALTNFAPSKPPAAYTAKDGHEVSLRITPSDHPGYAYAELDASVPVNDPSQFYRVRMKQPFTGVALQAQDSADGPVQLVLRNVLNQTLKTLEIELPRQQEAKHER
ncbi:MAG: hypothetical protein AAFR74_07215 [Pseudomonadota bacterium]